jgi:hypothetical protein
MTSALHLLQQQLAGDRFLGLHAVLQQQPRVAVQVLLQPQALLAATMCSSSSSQRTGMHSCTWCLVRSG